MDAAFFLRIRTNFIRHYYATGIAPFREIQRMIGAGERPYDEPPVTFRAEDGEPAFLDAWIEADDGAQVLGRSAVSLLSDSLKLYFKALEQQLAFGLSKEQKGACQQERLRCRVQGSSWGTSRRALDGLPGEL